MDQCFLSFFTEDISKVQHIGSVIEKNEFHLIRQRLFARVMRTPTWWHWNWLKSAAGIQIKSGFTLHYNELIQSLCPASREIAHEIYVSLFNNSKSRDSYQ